MIFFKKQFKGMTDEITSLRCYCLDMDHRFTQLEALTNGYKERIAKLEEFIKDYGEDIAAAVKEERRFTEGMANIVNYDYATAFGAGGMKNGNRNG